MSWVLTAVLAIFAVCGFAGWRKGIIKIIVSLATLVITLLGAAFLTPLLGNALKSNTELYDKLQHSVYSAISESNNFQQAVDDTVSDSENGQTQITGEMNQENIEGITSYVAQIVEVLNLPEDLAHQIDTAISQENLMKLIGNGESSLRGVLTAIIAVRLTDIIFNTIIYIIVFIAIFMILRIVVAATGLISYLPIIHQANKAVGLIFGLAEGLILVWLMFAVITAFGNSEWAADVLADIGSNGFLSFIYNNNLILKSAFRSL